eukprot:TRINITY_DN98381_c0_g1_i2.p1 TRINITY_DN98381_c0_g1~~TRINITY_DN98381_c0_g1_i2.p1  ORF type:complete len:103 (-),score=8.61 TRINITY_DN98381_c0_g1_i2:4-312(-)
MFNIRCCGFYNCIAWVNSPFFNNIISSHSEEGSRLYGPSTSYGGSGSFEANKKCLLPSDTGEEDGIKPPPILHKPDENNDNAKQVAKKLRQISTPYESPLEG